MQHTAQSTVRARSLQRRVAAREWFSVGIVIFIVCLLIVFLLIGPAFMSQVIDFIPLILAMSPS